MGDLTLDEMRTALRFDLEQLSNLTDGQLDRWLGWAYRHVCIPRVFRHSELQTETEITLVLDLPYYTVSVPYYVDHVLFVDADSALGQSSSDYSLRRKRLVGPKDLREFEDRNWARSEPTEYARWANRVYVNNRPGPSQVGRLLLVRGFTRPAVLENGATTVLRPEFDEVIIAGARWRGFRSLGRYDIAEVAKADFADLMREQQEQRLTEAEDWGGYFELETQEYQE